MLQTTQENAMDHMEEDFYGKATWGDALREYARNAGMDRPDQAWISTPWDVLMTNPFYNGPDEPYPEDCM
jgi:hypothetical protein